MNYKRNIKNLIKFRNDLSLSKRKEKKEIKSILKWVNRLQRNVRTESKLINLNECNNWFLDKNNNLYHKSGQFF